VTTDRLLVTIFGINHKSRAERSLITASVSVPSQWLEPAFHPTYTRMLCTILRKTVPDSKEALHAAGLTFAQLERQQAFVSFEVSSRLILETLHRSGCPWLGLELGAMTQVSAHGSLGYAIASSRNVMQALEAVSRFAGLRTRAMEFGLTPHEVETEIVIRELFGFGEVRIFILEAVVVMLARMIESLSGKSMERAEYTFPYAAPPWVNRYTPALKGTAHFKSSCMSIRVPNEIVNTSCLSADPVAYTSAIRECEQKLESLRGEVSAAKLIRNRLREREGSYPTLEALANELNISTRTLIRRLKQEDTSYQALLDETRKELAKWYLLNSSESVEAIAERLGYLDTSNFSRTFHRWFGISPTAFRQSRK
jgi:AraC-like DNA-binding protein